MDFLGPRKRAKTIHVRHVHRRRRKNLFYRIVTPKTFFIVVFVSFVLLTGLYASAYPDIHQLELAKSGQTVSLEPLQSMMFTFNQPVVKDDGLDLKISPHISGKIVWTDHLFNNYYRSIQFVPDAPYQPGAEYVAEIKHLSSMFGTELTNLHATFHTLPIPEIAELTPAEGSTLVPTVPDIRAFIQNNSRYFRFDFTLTPDSELEQKENDSADLVTLRPRTSLHQGTEYTFTANVVYLPYAEEGREEQQVRSVISHFTTVPPLVVSEHSPANDEQVRNNRPDILLTFDREVDYKSAEDALVIDPAIRGKKGWEKNTLIFAPEEDLEKGKTYTVKVARTVKAFQDPGTLDADLEFQFTVKKESPKEVALPADFHASITEGKYIDVDISEQKLTLVENGKAQVTFQISTGKYDMPTPLGQFQILSKKPLAYSGTYDLYMPFWMAFTNVGHGFHELPYWKYKGGADYHEREAHLGTRVSHGCIRLGVGPAEEMYNWADVGTPIVIHN